MLARKPAMTAGLGMFPAKDTPTGVTILSRVHVSQQPVVVYLVAAGGITGPKQSLLSVALGAGPDRHYEITHDLYTVWRAQWNIGYGIL